MVNNQILLNDFKSINTTLTDSVTVMVANEGFLSSISNFFVSKFDAICRFFTYNVTEYAVKTDPFIKELVANSRNLNKYLDVQYSNISDIVVPVNEAYKGTLLEITDNVLTGLGIVQNNIISSLEDTAYLVTKLVSDPQFLSSSRPIHIDEKVTNDINHGYKLLDQLVDSNSITDIKYVRDIVPNVVSIQEVVSRVVNIDTRVMYDVANKSDKLSKHIHSNVNVLTNNFKNDKYKDISKEALSALANKVEQSAKLVTLLGIYMYNLSQVAVLSSNLVTVLKKAKAGDTDPKMLYK